MATPLPFAQGFYVSESLPISAQECINLFPSPPQTGTVTDMALFNSAGISSEFTVGISADVNRGMHRLGELLFIVNGDTLYRVDNPSEGTYEGTDVSGGVSIDGSDHVIMADNGTQICIVAPDDATTINAWIFTVAGGLIKITDAGFSGPANGVVYIDGFFAFPSNVAKEFFVSALNDGFSYNALDFGSAEVDPDPISALFVLRNQLYAFGSETVESFQNIGGSGFPFQRIQGQVIQKGISAIYSITEVNDNMIWVGRSVNERPAIWMSNGGTLDRISTTAIENTLDELSDDAITGAFVVKYAFAGNYFIAFTFPASAAALTQTFEYNFTSGLWNQRASNDTTSALIGWRVSAVGEAFGVIFTGDEIDNRIGILDKDTFTEYAQTLTRTFVTPPFDNEGNPFFTSSVEIFLESGTATAAGDGSDPMISMSISDDGGRSFATAVERSMGLQNDFTQRAIWNRQGMSPRERMLKFSVTEPIKVTIIKAEVNIG